MAGGRVERRLAAILAADVAGYSRLMGADEEGTLARLSELRRAIVDPEISAHDGRLFKAMGDGLLVEFNSAVQAVSCGWAIQQANSEGPLTLRIGIHLGDVVVDGDDLMGDGVNIAARLEGVADPGGIAISRAVHEQIRDKVELVFEDRGEAELKNLVRPVHVFAVAGPAALAPNVPKLALPDKPSIAILPFQNMSGDPEQEYFADGISEDITTALSRFRSLFVIARNSSFTYKNRAVDIKQVGRELGVRYVLEGSVRKAGNRLRISGQLVETESGAHVWADRFEGTVADVFDLQDRITQVVVSTLEPAILDAELARVRRQPPKHLRAYDHYLRSLARTDVFTRQSAQQMLDEALQAIEIDPDFAPGYVLIARVYIQRLIQGWMVDERRESHEVLEFVDRGLKADRRDAAMVGVAGHCFAFFARDLSKGIAHIDEAIDLNPNFAHAYLQSGIVRPRAGETRVAIEHLQQARRLSPRDSRNYSIFQALSLAHHVDGDPAIAADWARKSVQHNPNYRAGWTSLAAACAAIGADDEARRAAMRVLELQPSFTVSRWANLHPISAAEKFEPVLEGLRRAGLPH